LGRTAAAQDDTETFKPNGPIVLLRKSILDGALGLDSAKALRETGTLQWQDADKLINALCTAAGGFAKDAKVREFDTSVCSRTAFLHILRFKDEDHEKTQYQEWLVRETAKSLFGAHLIKTHQGMLETSFVRGEQDFLFIYIHFLAQENEDIKDSDGKLKHPIGYEITAAKKKPQIVSDASLLLQVLGFGSTGVGAAAVEDDPTIAYFSVFSFHSAYSRSELTISATLPPKNQESKGKADDTKANNTIKKNYTNEKPQWVGLSIGVPLNSYRDVDYNESNNSLEAKTVKRENVYAVGNLYLPPVDIGQTQIRYLPHLLFGVPIKGQPLRHLMAGAGIGLNWVEPFVGVVFNRQQIPVAAGSTQLKDHLVRKLVVGINIPVATAKAALGKK
jgi:hypothetical protein